MWFIGVAIVAAVFACALAPDGSPNADRRLVELKAKPPGFSKLFLEVPLTHQPTPKPFLARLFTGSLPGRKLVPINNFFFARDTVYVSHYVANGQQDTLAFQIRNLLPARLRQQSLGDQQLAVFNHIIHRHTFWLGTDSGGRDVLSRLLSGLRISLLAGFAGGLCAICIGFVLGVIAGYFGGRSGVAIAYFLQVLSAIPYPLLVFAVLLRTGGGLPQIIVAIGVVMWVAPARLIYNEVSAVSTLQFVGSARMLGLSHLRIILRHVIPNIAGQLLAIAASAIAAIILLEAGLSFLGIGVQAPIPSLGLMVREECHLLTAHRPLPVIVPGVAIVMLAYAFNIIGNALRRQPDTALPEAL